jgi:hypothetical protein
MIRRILFTLSLGVALSLGGPAGHGAAPAAAQACLSQNDVRAAVESGRAIPLSSVLGQIRASVGGEILSSPMLCDFGGQLMYVINVLSAGNIVRVQVSAANGAISY